MRDDETIIRCELGTVEVRNDNGPLPEQNQGHVFLAANNVVAKEAAFIGVCADELRDAIDKAVGPRETDKLLRDQASIYHEVAVHPVFDECWTFDTPSAEAMIEKLDELHRPAPIKTPGLRNAIDTAAEAKSDFATIGYISEDGVDLVDRKPYRPIDRDRLLRHIEDIEATLARRNRRHEEDQERIRELEGIAMRRGDRIDELEAKLEAEATAPSLDEQIEALKKVPAGYEAVLDPPRLLDTPESREWAAPPIMVDRIYRDDPARGLRFRDSRDGYGWYARPDCALQLGVTAEDFGPSAEARRKEYEDKGLADWEIELLLGA